MKGKGIFYTGYFSISKNLIDKRVAVCRRLPTWSVKGRDYDDWWLDLAPSGDLLDDYKYRGLTVESYIPRYVAELKSNPNGLLMLRDTLNNGETVTGMCVERLIDKYGNPVFCHRNLLRQIIVKNGFLALEWSTTTVPFDEHNNLNEFITGDKDLITLPNTCYREVSAILKHGKLNYHITEGDNDFVVNKIMEFRIFVGGSRNYHDYSFITKTLDEIISKYGLGDRTRYKVIIVQGEAYDGVDPLAKRYAIERGYTHEDYPADWDNIDAPGAKIRYRKSNGKPYNRLAGFWRNEDMAKISNLMVLFHKDNSPGTADDKRLAKKYQIPLEYFIV